MNSKMILLLEKLNPFFDRPLIPLRTFLMNVAVAVCVIGFIRSGSLVASGAEPVGRPNVIVILTDDQGWGDLSLHGNPNLSTPNIDSLARDGAQVDHFYVCAVCSPTRAEFLTGRYHDRMGVYSTSSGGERFSADETTIGDLFKGAGYSTAAFGKWHSGMQFPYHPNARGFDEYYGFCSGHWGHYFSPMLEHNGRIVKGDGFLVDDLTDRAMEFIDGHLDEPFFVYLPLNTPHSPMQVPDQQWQKFADANPVPDPRPKNGRAQDLQHTRAALAMCENIDMNVGRLLEHLDRNELADDTIVVFFCDNGPNGHRFNGGMRGRKGSTYEGGLRSPCLIRYPAGIGSGSHVKSIGGAIDLLPTLASLCNVSVDSTKPLDGVSLAGELKQTGKTKPRLIFSSWKSKASVRSQQFRYHATGDLYDIHADPGEEHDLAGENPKIAMRMKRALEKWQAETAAESVAVPSKRPFVLGHPDALFTQLPVRDAVAMGKIKRSNKFPNCTFFHNWTNTNDSISWDVDVPASGEFEVQLYYACEESDVGAKLRLTLGDSTRDAKIETANPSPLIGAKEDRFVRAEGYVKNWQPMTVGRMKLSAGRGKLTLTATEIPGDEVGDIRLLMFQRVK